MFFQVGGGGAEKAGVLNFFMKNGGGGVQKLDMGGYRLTKKFLKFSACIVFLEHGP